MENIKVSDYGITQAGKSVQKYTLRNKNGMKAEIISFGGIITSLTAPDRDGNYSDVVLGFADPQDYFNQNDYYLGAVIGRYGNRIARAEFNLEGEKFTLDRNDGQNSLHGGQNGFHTKIWEVGILEELPNAALKLNYISDDGEAGFPGELAVCVIYTLTDDDALQISYQAITSKTTVVNLTQHTYFNLSGDFGRTVLDHELAINADQYLPTDEAMIPTGEFRNVQGTAFDFRKAKRMAKDIGSEETDVRQGSGFDHTWILSGTDLKKAATAFHPETGRVLEVLTTEPGVQFYSGNHLDGKLEGKSGQYCGKHTGFCLETQHFPDAPNQSAFPSVILKPGEVYESRTIYKFSAVN